MTIPLWFTYVFISGTNTKKPLEITSPCSLQEKGKQIWIHNQALPFRILYYYYEFLFIINVIFHAHLTGWDNQLNHILQASSKFKNYLNLEWLTQTTKQCKDYVSTQ